MPTQIPVTNLLNAANPFENDIWGCGLVSKAKIIEAFGKSEYLDHDTWSQLKETTKQHEITQEQHAARIAFLMKEGWKDEIEVDVGVPSLGCVPGWICEDGNHRLCAAAVRGDEFVSVNVSGDLDYASELLQVEVEELPLVDIDQQPA